MRRREFSAGLGGAAAWPLAARAQQRERRVGVLTFGAEADDVSLTFLRQLREQLQKLGWIEGRNLRLDVRFGGGDVNRTRVDATEMVNVAPDVVVTVYGLAALAMQQETMTIPIVIYGAGDVYENGLVKNLARPEGNITGVTNAFGSLGGKWIQLLKEIAPQVKRVAVLFLTGGALTGYRTSIDTAGQSVGVQVEWIPVSDAASVKAGIERFAAEPNGGLFPHPNMVGIAPRELVELAEQYRLPAIYALRSFPVNGGLMSYAAEGTELIGAVVGYVDRILRGAKPSDLPIQFPAKFQMVLNLKTAKALGLEVPPSILLSADEVIE
jgi:putative tryptophan/tyrosine transport system substrate-binding protein